MNENFNINTGNWHKSEQEKRNKDRAKLAEVKAVEKAKRKAEVLHKIAVNSTTTILTTNPQRWEKYLEQ